MYPCDDLLLFWPLGDALLQQGARLRSVVEPLPSFGSVLPKRSSFTATAFPRHDGELALSTLIWSHGISGTAWERNHSGHRFPRDNLRPHHKPPVLSTESSKSFSKKPDIDKRVCIQRIL